MQTNHSTSAVLVFENVEFDIVDIHNIPWLRLPQVGAALAYENPYHLQKLYDRNADEFSEEMTQIVELDTAGGRQQVRIFSPRGCYLIGMLSRTEKAKEFRKWVLDVLEGRALPRESKPLSINQTLATHRLYLKLAQELKAETAQGMRKVIYQQMCFCGRILSLPSISITEIGREVVQAELPGV